MFFFASTAILTQYVEICLIAYRFVVEVRLVYGALGAIELAPNYAMESFYAAIVCRATRRYEAMFNSIPHKRLLKSAVSCASGGHNELRPVVRLLFSCEYPKKTSPVATSRKLNCHCRRFNSLRKYQNSGISEWCELLFPRTVTRVVPKCLAAAKMPNSFAYLTISSLICILLLDIGTAG